MVGKKKEEKRKPKDRSLIHDKETTGRTMRRRKRKKNRETPWTTRSGPRSILDVDTGEPKRRKKRRICLEARDRDQSVPGTWSKLFNNLILRGYLFAVTFPIGMQTS